MTGGPERAVADASTGGRSIEDIDRSVIGPAAISDEHKAALWLLAWSFLPDNGGRTNATVHLDRTPARR